MPKLTTIVPRLVNTSPDSGAGGWAARWVGTGGNKIKTNSAEPLPFCMYDILFTISVQLKVNYIFNTYSLFI